MLDRLSKLKLEEKNLQRLIDCSYNRENRTRMLNRLKVVKKEIRETKSKLRLERELKKNEKFRKNI